MSPVAACCNTATVSIFVSSAPLPLALEGTNACMSDIRGVCVCCVCLCLDVFFLEAGEAEGGGVVRTSTLGVCVCVKRRQGENRGTRLYNGVRTQSAWRRLHQSAAAATTHPHTHTPPWPTDLTRPAVICHLAANWAVSAGLLLASGLMIIPPL